uniref:Nucleoside diphosphate kinase-like domain-containing protein n=1 Tax=Latimeria chalumnae TaxID=7897 RepID=H3ADY3_LATCH
KAVFFLMLAEPHLLFSVVLIKPSTWPRHLAKILRKLNLEKFNVVGLKLLTLNTEMASRLTTPSVQQDASLLQSHLSYLTSGSSIALCVQRENAIKKLLDLLGQDDPQECRTQGQFLWRAQYGTDLIQNGLYGSLSYQGAVCDVEVFFQEGLCCPETLLMEEELLYLYCSVIVLCLLLHFCYVVAYRGGGLLSTENNFNTLDKDIIILSALCQTTCLLLPSLFLRGHHHPPYIELLDQLIRSEFVLTGVRLTVMDEAQARHIVDILHIAEGLLSVVSLLSEGPCLILALQRDNALSCCDSLLDSLSWEKMDLQKYRQYLIYPKNEQQAEDLLCCLFDSLAPHSIHQIVSQDF